MRSTTLLAFSAVLLLSLLPPVLPASFPRTATNVQPLSALAVSRLNSIQNFIVIMLENESFDQLFPNIPNTESLTK